MVNIQCTKQYTHKCTVYFTANILYTITCRLCMRVIKREKCSGHNCDSHKLTLCQYIPGKSFCCNPNYDNEVKPTSGMEGAVLPTAIWDAFLVASIGGTLQHKEGCRVASPHSWEGGTRIRYPLLTQLCNVNRVSKQKSKPPL